MFETHSGIMAVLAIDLIICAASMATTIVPASSNTHVPFFRSAYIFSRYLAHVMILLILLPPFGWLMFTAWVLVLAYLLHHSHQ